MAPVLTYLLLLFIIAFVSYAQTDQKLLGPSYELPSNLPSSQVIKDATSGIKASLKDAIRTGETSYGSFNGNTTSFSATVVSQQDSAPVLDFHHTSMSLNITAGSTSKVTADTVYRIGSVSKLFTVYLLLLNNGMQHWNRPVTDFIPELHDAENLLSVSPIIDRVQWDQVTVGALASQLSGIGRDYNQGDLATQDFPWEEAGLPTLPQQDIPSCAANDTVPPCSRKDYFSGFIQHHPVFPPSSKPLYSNTAYRILAYVIEALAGKTYEESVEQDIFRPLGLHHSSPLPPKGNGIGVIPNGPAGWDRDYGDEAATGGLLSSTNDLVNFGRAIFAHKQLSIMETNWWMKPNSLTSSTSLSVGAPWEIVRTRNKITSGHLIDLYTKSGSVGLYESLLILIPDYEITIAVNAAGPDASQALHVATEIIVQNLLPAFEKIAAAEACNRFCGEYRTRNSPNSSLTLTVDDQPGLSVQQWFSQGRDILAAAQGYADATRGGEITGVRLFPTGLQIRNQAAYRALFLVTPYEYNPKVQLVFDPKASIWGMTDQLMYGNIAVDEFVFHLDETGVATAVEPRVMREVYEKVVKKESLVVQHP